MFDLNATRKWVTAMLADPNAAADAYQTTSAGWQQSFVQITLPVLAVAYLAAIVISLLTGGGFMMHSTGLFVFSLIWTLGWTFVIAFIFDYLAGVFEGQRSFDGAYAVVALVMIPAALGTALSPVPWLGWLVGLAAGIYSLILSYRFLPKFLAIPEPARVKHFVLSIVAAFLVNVVVSLTLGAFLAPTMIERSAGSDLIRPEAVSNGLFSGLERQADVAEQAGRDVYEPPGNGRITDAQMQRLVDVVQKTQALRERLDTNLSKTQEKDKPSVGDIFGSIGGVVRMGTAEMEVVKTAGGNWAEHQWVKRQVETARIQQDLNETTQHNYDLFLKYEDQLADL